MLKIVIDGEGKRKKRIFNNWREAENEYYMRLSEAQEEEGYLKTWIEILENNEQKIKMRLDLSKKSDFISLKKLLLDQMLDNIKICKEHMPKYEKNARWAYNYIKNISA